MYAINRLLQGSSVFFIFIFIFISCYQCLNILDRLWQHHHIDHDTLGVQGVQQLHTPGLSGENYEQQQGFHFSNSSFQNKCERHTNTCKNSVYIGPARFRTTPKGINRLQECNSKQYGACSGHYLISSLIMVGNFRADSVLPPLVPVVFFAV